MNTGEGNPVANPVRHQLHTSPTPSNSTLMHISLDEESFNQLKACARAKGTAVSVLAHQWIQERLKHEAAAIHHHA